MVRLLHLFIEKLYFTKKEINLYDISLNKTFTIFIFFTKI